MDEKSADVVFEVEEENDMASPPRKFYAHSLILKNASHLFADLCKSPPCTIPISDVSPGIFSCMLHSVYGCDSSDIGQGFKSECGPNKNMTDVIKAANKYGLTNLKLRAEVFHVSLLSGMIDLDNFMDQLQFANSKNLYLLQEAVMDLKRKCLPGPQKVSSMTFCRRWPGGKLTMQQVRGRRMHLAL
jgi:hypothetical protein